MTDTGTLAEEFRDVMSGVCTPVSVVTAMDRGRPHGTTVSAFASLSMCPPMVLVSLDLESELLGLLRVHSRFGVNVLGSGQAGIAKRFAGKGDEKFAGVRWEVSEGLPRLPGNAGWLACEASRLVEGGDHVIALGTITAAAHTDVPPLTYHARGFGTHLPLEP